MEAAIVLHSVPPLGIIPYEFSFLKSTWGALRPFTSLKDTYLMPFKTWQYAFTNGMTLEDQKKACEENTIPGSKRVARGGLTLAARHHLRMGLVNTQSGTLVFPLSRYVFNMTQKYPIDIRPDLGIL